MQIYSTSKKTDIEPLILNPYFSENINVEEIEKSTKNSNMFRVIHELLLDYILYDLIVLNCVVFLTPYLAKKSGLFYVLGFYSLFWFYLHFL